ncbi:AfsR/SARP family transcriptional regulator [Actinoplanes ianthinogenes]|uniref:AfsR/SARP family transcriptional regulator n=1 Tax=Actinoplanes ianthinogenes TaxID=122358 RepID=UPI00227D80D9|nr:BTAD domain-containing putative transcriptional regulator [Actinoplanes ianthinogenes]
MAVTAGRDRIVLAMLLLDPNRIVVAGELVDALWGSAPPATARGQLQSCISRLRRMLPVGAILTDRAGYGIHVEPGELDAEVFAQAVEKARADADPAAYRRALALRRGPACAELDAPAIRQAAAVLDERYALAVEDWADLELAAGRERELTGELSALVERFPLRERMRGQLMLALARSGRQADALTEFRRARQLLADELGIEPGEELQERHRQILNGEISAGSGAEPAASGPVRCLPRTVGDFTGRREQIDRLLADRLTDDAGPRVAVIDGMAGSGKTTLALHLAALAGDRYPDAHLFVDLQGHSERDPVEPAAALHTLLRQLGLAVEEIPLEPMQRVARWRTEAARRRLLVVLDNAASSTQIADLLPTAPGSLALVTSRRRLAGLDGARVESLPVLSPDEAVALLEQIAGDRVRAEPAASAEVVRRCGLLPLAIRLAGARLAHRPRWRVADLLRRLSEAALPELAAEDRTVTGAFALTYGQLPAPLQRVFRLLGVYPGADFDALAVAALADLARDTAEDLLEDLLDVNLVDEPEPGVFRLHDLMREYAEMLAAELPAADRTAALTAVLDFQLHAAIATASASHRALLLSDLGQPVPSRPDLVVADPIARLERERPNLVALVEAATGTDYAWQIPRAAWQVLYFHGYTDDLRALQRIGLAAAEMSGNRAAIATSANYLASVYSRVGQDDQAEEHLRRSIRLREELGQIGAALVGYPNLAVIYLSQGRFAESLELLETARSRRRFTKHVSQSPLLAVLVDVLSVLGRPEEALYYARLRLLSTIENREDGGLAGTLLSLQRLRYRLGTLSAAAAHHYIDMALWVSTRIGYQSTTSDAHHNRARVLREEGRYDEAIREHRRAVEISVRLTDVRHQADFRHDYAVTLRRLGDRAGARAMFEQVVRVARAGGHPYWTARAQVGLADCLEPGDPEADRLRAQARETFERIGITEEIAAAY